MPDCHELSQGAAALVSGIRDGDRQAFEWFYRMEYHNLRHFINSYLHDNARAEDLAQETFCALWENRAGLDPQKNLRAYVFTMARNRTLNFLKSRKLYGGANRPELLEESVELLQDASADELIRALDLEKLIASTMDSMPPKTREFFTQSRKEGLGNKEIASKQGVSVKTVEYHIHVALKHLKKNIQNLYLLF